MKWPIRREVVTGKGESTPYLTRYICFSLRLHVFHRGDVDLEPHDHPWDFWTFPFNKGGYIEEQLYTVPPGKKFYYKHVDYLPGEQVLRNVQVPSWKWTKRRAEHAHRVLYPQYGKPGAESGYRYHVDNYSTEEFKKQNAAWPIITLVWIGKSRRKWGFWKQTVHGMWAWIHWKEFFKDQPRRDNGKTYESTDEGVET